MSNISVFDVIALVLVIIGGINWGLVGIFHFDIVAAIFGDMSMISRIVYTVVGVAAIYSAYFVVKMKKH